MFNKFFVLIAIMLATTSLNASAPIKILAKDNENIELVISREQYNRLYIEGDKIRSMRYPKNRLSALEEKDGSWYLDLLDDRPFTLFFITQKGRHFSATVKNKDTLGQTIAVLFLDSQKHLATRQPRVISEKQRYEKNIKEMIALADKEQSKKGYITRHSASPSYRFHKNLKARHLYSVSKGNLKAEKYSLSNKGNTPILLKEEWLKDANTKALMHKKKIIYPNETITLVRVEKESKHG